MRGILRGVELVLTYTVPGAVVGTFLAALARVLLNNTGSHYGPHADPSLGWPYVSVPWGAALGFIAGLVVLLFVVRFRGRQKR